MGVDASGHESGGTQADADRIQAVALLLRQLASGFSAYRLFPGDTEQPAFKAAVLRVRNAAKKVMADGPVEVGIHGEGFSAPGLPDGDEQRARFAMALFERRVEWLEVRSIPDADELAAFYAAVAQPTDELTGQGGLADVLRQRGVTAMAVRGAELNELVTGSAPGTVELNDEQRDLWNRLQDPEGFAASMLVESLGGGSHADQAEWVYRRFATVLSILPDRLANSSESFQRLQQVTRHIPPNVRRAFNSLTVTRADKDLLAMGYVGSMSDADLARMLVDLGESGPDPVELAQRLVDGAGRQQDVVDFTRTLAADGEEGGTIVADPGKVAGFSDTGLTDRGWGEGAGTGASAAAAGTAADGGPEVGREPDRDADADDSRNGTVTRTAADVLARGVALAADDDVEAVRVTFPDTDEDVRTLALAALRDYLLIEFDHERLGQTLESCAAGLKDAILVDHARRFERLLRVIDEVSGEEGSARREIFEAHRGKVLQDDVVATLVRRGREDGLDAVSPYLAPFDGLSVKRFFDHLAEEEDRGVRAWLVGALADLARPNGHPGYTHLVADRLDDERWYVVRNAVTILQRIGDGDALPEVVRAADHPEPRVRREAVRALATLAGNDAVTYLKRLAVDADPNVAGAARQTLAGIPTSASAAVIAGLVRSASDRSEAHGLLDVLGDHAAPQATERLRELASRSSQPRLPWTLRRHARKLARQRERDTS